MGNKIGRKAPVVDHDNDQRASNIQDLQRLHLSGREYLLDLQNKLLKTQTDRDTLEQELSTVRTWLDRVEAGNAELLEALKDARAKTSSLTSELDLKKQRIVSLEAEVESLQVRLTETEYATKGSMWSTNVSSHEHVSQQDGSHFSEQIDSEKDYLIAQYQKEIADLKLELRKKDRSMRKEIRRHSKQIRHISEAELASEWQVNQDLVLDADSKKSIYRSVDIIFRTHRAALARADKLARTLYELNAIQLREAENQQKEWQVERSVRRDYMRSFDVPGTQDTAHANISHADIDHQNVNADLEIEKVSTQTSAEATSYLHMTAETSLTNATKSVKLDQVSNKDSMKTI